MTNEQIKEQLSLHYVGAIISRAGHQIILPQSDFGVDLVIRETHQYLINNTRRFLTSGNVVDIQLKCTTLKNIEFIEIKGERFVKYDLDAKNYNDLIYRRKLKDTQFLDPLALLLVVLSENENEWLQLSFDDKNEQHSMTFNGAAYWFYPDKDMALSNNKSSKRITIPAKQKVDLNFLKYLFDNF